MKRVVLSALVGLVVAMPAPAVSKPLTVSPGHLERFPVAESACPTFSWASVVDARLYELVISAAAEEVGIDVGAPVLGRTFRGQVTSWTPAQEDCLEPGRVFGWSIRAQIGSQWTSWSDVRFFETPGHEAVPGRSAKTPTGSVQGVAAIVDPLRRASLSAPPETSALPASTQYGLYVDQVEDGTEPVVGIYAKAFSVPGSTTWAGYFDGSVNVTGSLWAAGVNLDELTLPASQTICRTSIGWLANCSSSRRFKQRIRPLELEGLATVERLEPVQFRWTDAGADLGFVAEDVAAVDPLLATFGERGDVQGVKYRQLTAVLVKALQEQRAEFAAFRARVEQELAELRAGQAGGASRPPEACRE